MASRRATKPAINTAAQNTPAPGHRERLTAAMIAAANRDGYTGATVSAVVAEAGVSRPTFYEHFNDRDDCFLQTLTESQTELLEQIRTAVEQAPADEATAAAITALIEHARTQPAAARFIANEPLAATLIALDARDQHLEEVAKIIERSQRKAPADASTPDLPGTILLGAVSRLLGSQLRRGEPGLTAIQTELLDWASRYEQPRSGQRWRTGKPGPAPEDEPTVLESLMSEPAPLPRGRPRMSSEEIAVNHRQRILHAVARLAAQKGYEATTTADIAREAKVDPKVFYRLFTDKREAFMSYHELGFQQLMATMASAFFNGETWPERAWHSGNALLHLLQREPLVAHIGFVESYAVGPAAIQRVEDSHTAFTMFLQEGYRYREKDGNHGGEPPGRLALDAIVAGIYELVYQQVRAGRTERLPRYLGLMGTLAFTPFLGPDEANRFIDEQLTRKPVERSR
jgi:AcrR family transcriptional regulator